MAHTRIIDCLVSVEIKAGGIVVATLLSDDNGAELFAWGTRVSEHRLNPRLVNAFEEALDTVLEDESARCLIVHGQGRFFSNGMDLQWIDQNQNLADAHQQATEKLLARLLSFPVPTLAAINGHICAAGAMFGLAFDYRIMVQERAKFFVPAVDLGLIYSSGMVALMQCKTPHQMHRDMILFSKKYTSSQLLSFGVVEVVVSDPASVLSACISFASTRVLISKERFQGQRYRHVLGETKERLYKNALHHLRLCGQGDVIEPMGFDSGDWDAHGRSKL